MSVPRGVNAPSFVTFAWDYDGDIFTTSSSSNILINTSVVRSDDVSVMAANMSSVLNSRFPGITNIYGFLSALSSTVYPGKVLKACFPRSFILQNSGIEMYGPNEFHIGDYSYNADSNQYKGSYTNLTNGGWESLVTYIGSFDSGGSYAFYRIPLLSRSQFQNGKFNFGTTGDIVINTLHVQIGPGSQSTAYVYVYNTKFTVLNPDNWRLLNDTEPIVTTMDPYIPDVEGPGAGGPTSSSQGGDGTGGGFGDFDYHSDDVSGSDAPTISAADSGMLSIHIGDVSNMQALGNYLWSQSFDLNNFKKLLANPMDCILGCHLIPNFSGLTVTGGIIKVGNISTGVSFPIATHQFYKFSCGSISITSQSLSHSFMDFLPHLHCYLYLPFIGIVPISTDEVIDHTLSVSYICDVATGSVIAQVEMDGNLIYNYTGNFAAGVPISSGEYNNILQSVLQTTQILTSGFLNATGGASGGTGVLSDASLMSQISMFRGAAQANYATLDTTNQVLKNVLSTVKPAISRSGSFSGTAGFMANRVPFLIISAPNLAVPKDQNHYTGYPQYETVSLGNLSGYTQVAAVHLEGFAATEEEKSEILAMLSEGVLF